jgi:hypothetical protein
LSYFLPDAAPYRHGTIAQRVADLVRLNRSLFFIGIMRIFRAMVSEETFCTKVNTTALPISIKASVG